MLTQFNFRRFLPYPLPTSASAPPSRGTGDPRFMVNSLSSQTLPRTSVAPVDKLKRTGYMTLNGRRGTITPIPARRMVIDSFTVGLIRTRRGRR